VAGELRPGASLRFDFREHAMPHMEGSVTEFDPPHRFAYWWGEDLLGFALESVDGGGATLLRFTVQLGTEDKAARDAAGWHVCLDRLAAQLAGSDAVAPGAGAGAGATGEWQDRYDEYQRRGLPATAPIPSR
jgi:hypothetical protein